VTEAAGGDVRLRLACRVAEKAYLAKQTVVVWFDDGALMPRFDELLWTFADGSFVPHDIVQADGACQSPVALTTGPLPADHLDMLINLGNTVPASHERFARIAEFLDARPEVRAAGRERFKVYRGKSLDPQTHNV
jgi:DNA polymerase-3 subunit chi